MVALYGFELVFVVVSIRFIFCLLWSIYSLCWDSWSNEKIAGSAGSRFCIPFCKRIQKQETNSFSGHVRASISVCIEKGQSWLIKVDRERMEKNGTTLPVLREHKGDVIICKLSRHAICISAGGGKRERNLPAAGADGFMFSSGGAHSQHDIAREGW